LNRPTGPRYLQAAEHCSAHQCATGAAPLDPIEGIASIPQRGEGDEPERRLLARVGDGDRDAFRELYLRYHRRLARFLARLTHRREDAEEIINDTMWIVWQRASDFRGASRVSTWVMGIAYRRALKMIRRAVTHERAMLLESVDGEPSREDEIESTADRRLLERALAQLPLEQRLVLELTYYLDHSCEEIAEIMECPANTVKTRMFHARRKLRLLLGESHASGAP
jgi:RNA polymerase sigma-70 factor (ECF subfamily)